MEPEGAIMLLDIAKAASFLVSLLLLCRTAQFAFFIPGTRWQDRLAMTGLRLVFAACVCLFSGVLFTWPAPDNPDRGKPLTASMPVRLLFWATTAIAVLFASAWYLGDLAHDAAPFISNRSHEGQ